MRTMNDLPDGDDTSPRWSVESSYRRAIRAAALGALICAIALAPLSAFAPVIALGGFLRAVLAFIVAWILFSIAHGATGMGSWPGTFIACGFAIAVFLVQQTIHASCGAPQISIGGGEFWEVLAWPLDHLLADGGHAGAFWFTPRALFFANLPVVAGIGLCAITRHSGQIDTQSLLGLLSDR